MQSSKKVANRPNGAFWRYFPLYPNSTEARSLCWERFISGGDGMNKRTAQPIRCEQRAAHFGR